VTFEKEGHKGHAPVIFRWPFANPISNVCAVKSKKKKILILKTRQPFWKLLKTIWKSLWLGEITHSLYCALNLLLLQTSERESIEKRKEDIARPCWKWLFAYATGGLLELDLDDKAECWQLKWN